MAAECREALPGLVVRAALLPEGEELRVERRLLVSAIETAKRANNRERSL
jgi:hypothetical protein